MNDPVSDAKLPGPRETPAATPIDGVLFPLLILGLILSGFLSYAKMTDHAAFCPGESSSACERIYSSPYAHALGIPVAYLGNHAVMILLSLWLLRRWGPVSIRGAAGAILFVVAAGGAVFSGYLTFAQIFLLDGLCPICLALAATFLGLAVSSGLARAAGLPGRAAGGDRVVPTPGPASGHEGETAVPHAGWPTVALRPGLVVLMLVPLTVLAVLSFGVAVWASELTGEVRDLRQEVRRWAATVEQGAARSPGAIPGERYEVETGDSPSLGPSDAPVTIVEFSSFECRYCSLVVPALKEVHETFPSRVRIVFKHYPPPLDESAMTAHAAAEAAREQGKFWEMHDLLFEDGGGPWDEDRVLALAGRIGLDRDRFRAALDSDRVRATIREDRRLGEDLGIPGSPSFFINGEFLPGRKTYGFFESKIRSILGEEGSR